MQLLSGTHANIRAFGTGEKETLIIKSVVVVIVKVEGKNCHGFDNFEKVRKVAATGYLGLLVEEQHPWAKKSKKLGAKSMQKILKMRIF